MDIIVKMGLSDQIARSQLVPPRWRKDVLLRARLETRFLAVQDYPITIVQAGTGYGKSTALSSLIKNENQMFWYSVAEEDRDPLLFFGKLMLSFDQFGNQWGKTAIEKFEKNGSRISPDSLIPIINALMAGLEKESVLVIDDYHLIIDVPEINMLLERLVDFCPPKLHIVISTRKMPDSDAFNRWRVKGQMLIISRSDLAFRTEEIFALFNDQYKYEITMEEAQILASETEGWAIALQMIWQSLQSGVTTSIVDIASRKQPTLEALFNYLAQEVYSRQSSELQHFLVVSSVLRLLDAQICNELLNIDVSDAYLKYLHDNGLFLVSSSNGVFRYQHLFLRFLQSLAKTDQNNWWELNHKAASIYEQRNNFEEMLYHLVEAQEFDEASDLIERIGQNILSVGRLESLLSWIRLLPQDNLSRRPGLLLLLGDIWRLKADFDQALENYSKAESLFQLKDDTLGRSRALRGQAQVYLDTVRPLKADSLLEEALNLIDFHSSKEEAAAIFLQLAENKVNSGEPERAIALLEEEHLLNSENQSTEYFLESRAFLRTGQLDQAKKMLESMAEEENSLENQRPQRFHRETMLLLSLVNSMQGDAEQAYENANKGIKIGKQLNSDYVVAVGNMRLGHALSLLADKPWNDKDVERAINCYRKAIEIFKPYKVSKIHVEPLWGISKAYGYRGELELAEENATQALNFAEQAGDGWIANLARINLGASYAIYRQNDKANYLLNQSLRGFEQVGDVFCSTAARFWLAMNEFWFGNLNLALDYLQQCLKIAIEKNFDYLFTKRTQLGLKDVSTVVPLLIEAREHGIEKEYVVKLLASFGLSDLKDHPGYSLYVRTLDSFMVWRGETPITAHEWQREKARQLFQLLITYKEQSMNRDVIIDRLWPDLDPDSAVRDFKVALNALNRALEPDRPSKAQPFFIIRTDNGYRINPLAKVFTDYEEFEELASSSDIKKMQAAIDLYQSDYLADCDLDERSYNQREKLRQTYLITAERLANQYLNIGKHEEALTVSQKILEKDNCWESAYRIMMQIYANMGNRAQIFNVYRKCEQTLQEELAITPSHETQELMKRLTSTRSSY